MNKKNILYILGILIFALSWTSFLWSFEGDGLLNHRYFTNQSIFLLTLTMTLYFSQLKSSPWFNFLATLTLVDLILTGSVYHFILDVESPISFQNHLSHTILPMLYFIFFYTMAIQFKLNHFYFLLVHPIIYFLVYLITGPFTGFYPYDFMDVSLNGWGAVLRFTLVFMLPGYSVLSYLVIYLNGRLLKNQE
jgi:hypothetical protein